MPAARTLSANAKNVSARKKYCVIARSAPASTLRNRDVHIGMARFYAGHQIRPVSITAPAWRISFVNAVWAVPAKRDDGADAGVIIFVDNGVDLLARGVYAGEVRRRFQARFLATVRRFRAETSDLGGKNS